jgi:hypothetical protein
MPWNSSKARLTALLLFAVIITSVAGCGRIRLKNGIALVSDGRAESESHEVS